MEESSPFVYVPQLVTDALWADMEDIDKVFCITSAYKTLLQFSKQEIRDDTRVGLHFAAGLAGILVDRCDDNYELIKSSCYREVFRLNVSYKMKFLGSDTTVGLLEQAEL